MPKKSFTTEQIISKLREAEVLISQGQSVPEACKVIGVVEQTFYRWRKAYGGLKIDQAHRLRELEQENTRLKHLVADLSLDNAIIKEALRGK
jgi:putative transposase